MKFCTLLQKHSFFISIGLISSTPSEYTKDGVRPWFLCLKIDINCYCHLLRVYANKWTCVDLRKSFAND